MSAQLSKRSGSTDNTALITGVLWRPGVTQVFVHCVASVPNSEALARIVLGYDRYCERALLLARPHDIVCLARPYDTDFLQFLHGMGMGPKPENIVVASSGDCGSGGGSVADRLLSDPVAIERIAQRIGDGQKVTLNSFIASPKEFQIAAALEAALDRKVDVLGGNPDIVYRAYHKHTIRAKARELGVPVAPGDVVELSVQDEGTQLDLSPLRVAIERNVGRTGRVIIRGSCGTSGSSTLLAENNAVSIQNALRRLSERNDNSIYLVDAMFDVTASPNIQMFIAPDNGQVSCVSIGDQRLTANLVHEGNVYPSRATKLSQMMTAARNMCGWLRAEGYTGLAGFDFVEYRSPHTGELEYFLAEVNARVNGVTYPKAIMERLNRKAGARPCVRSFLSANVRTTARSFAEIRDRYGHLFVTPGAGKGLFPYNVGCLENSKFSVAFVAQSRDEVQMMHRDFKVILARNEEALAPISP